MSWKVYSPSNVGVSGKYASLRNYPTWTPGALQPDHQPRGHGRQRPRPALLLGVPEPGLAALQKAFKQTFPNHFVADVNSGQLPSVSWIIPPLGFDEHPSASSANGMYFTSLVLDALTSNRKVWSKTAFFLMYDENDGWFDHVKPPTAPPGTKGEYLTTIAFPLGEPNARHAQLRRAARARRQGPDARHLTVQPGRAHRHRAVRPHLPAEAREQAVRGRGAQRLRLAPARGRRPDLDDVPRHEEHDSSRGCPATSVLLPADGPCAAVSQETESGGAGPSVPTKQRMPKQGGGSRPASHYFKMSEAGARDPRRSPDRDRAGRSPAR